MLGIKRVIIIYQLKHWIVILFIFLIGCQDEGLISPTLIDYTADFDSVWCKYDQKYPLFEYKNINWTDSYQNYRNRFISISINERNQLLAEVLSIFKDMHITITPSSGTVISPYVNHNIENNFNEVFINNFLTSNQFKKINDYWGWAIIDNIGYFRIKNFSSSKIDTLTFGSVVDSMKTTDGIIIDIREHYGGNLYISQSLWNHFSLSSQIVGYQQYRNGPNHSDYAPLIPIYANNNPSRVYVNTVVVLIGEGCCSAGEVFANSLSYSANVILVGDTTIGAVEAPSTFTLSDNTKYTVPIIAYLDILYKPLEWRGVAPDIYIDPMLINNNTRKDLAIEKAFEIIQTKAHITSVLSGILQ